LGRGERFAVERKRERERDNEGESFGESDKNIKRETIKKNLKNFKKSHHHHHRPTSNEPLFTYAARPFRREQATNPPFLRNTYSLPTTFPQFFAETFGEFIKKKSLLNLFFTSFFFFFLYTKKNNKS